VHSYYSFPSFSLFRVSPCDLNVHLSMPYYWNSWQHCSSMHINQTQWIIFILSSSNAFFSWTLKLLWKFSLKHIFSMSLFYFQTIRTSFWTEPMLIGYYYSQSFE
jgi:hypothetical protein